MPTLSFSHKQLVRKTNDLIQEYQRRRETITEHQPQLVEYLGARRFGETETD